MERVSESKFFRVKRERLVVLESKYDSSRRIMFDFVEEWRESDFSS